MFLKTLKLKKVHPSRKIIACDFETININGKHYVYLIGSLYLKIYKQHRIK